ncbi:MAG: CBS domain-containing protein [Gammaproteobacteria bacterium]|nr:CBS domain-containing protein [Gammaproteobacteria bacterium]
MRLVSEIMTPAVQAINRDDSIRDAERIFITQKISGAPISDDSGNLVGFVSKTDIIRFDSSGEDPTYTRLHEIANPNVVTVDPSIPINIAAQKMLEEHIHHLVVMEGNTVVGVLSAFDFVRLAAEFVAQDEDEDITENLFTHIDRH